MLFKEVVGQLKIKEKLIQAAKDNRISHAQLFLGAEGCGNLPMAIAYATYISCLNRDENDSCGECPSCMKYSKLIHPDLHFVFPVNTNKTITKDAKSDDFLSLWREFILSNTYFHEAQWYEYIGIENKQGFIGAEESKQIIKKLNFKPYESDYKIMIIWLPEKMNASAANKLLKMIEEPPDNTIFLMVSESTDGILPTILSRIQMIRFHSVDDNELRNVLKDKLQLPDPELNNLVHLASGNYLKAMDCIKANEEDEIHFKIFSDLMRMAFKNDIQKLTDITDELAALGRERQKRFLEYALGMIRENLVTNFGEEKIIYMNTEEKNFSVKFHPFVNRKNTHLIYELFNTALRDIEANGYAKIIFMDVALRMNGILKVN